jgi:hypothetical protein
VGNPPFANVVTVFNRAWTILAADRLVPTIRKGLVTLDPEVEAGRIALNATPISRAREERGRELMAHFEEQRIKRMRTGIGRTDVAGRN